ncbi:hypothetical protein SS50377_21614 [Spironucleus salmonicida]|uniref:Uncharacterized protein n=1 Tax=Spironucleus salmonicida TaxID=348837 RepID=A0A9P8LXH4_9EUKA|nr:hypothetical protein SS50377_21614 [Spironucleus salmonicida]
MINIKRFLKGFKRYNQNQTKYICIAYLKVELRAKEIKQRIYRTNFKKMDYNQFEIPYDCINILDNQVKTNIQKIKNETYRFDNQFIKQRWYTEKVSQLRAQNIKYEQMKSQRKTRIQKGLEPRMLNKLNNEIDKISKLQGIAEIEEFKINYDKYTNENDTILETIRKDFKLDQMDLKYINSFEDFQNKFNSKIHFEIITDAPYMGLYYGKSNYQDTYAFANIRYIKQNGNIIPIGFIIQNQMSSLLESIFEEVMDNGEKYFNRDVSSTDIMLFQNIGVINVYVLFLEQIVLKIFKDKDEFYVSEVDSQYAEGYQIGLVCRNVGNGYQQNATVEQKFKGPIFFVKNNDHNCLYAAIIATFTKKSKTVDKKHIFQLGAKPYAMATIVFDAGKALQTYLDKPLDKTQARNQYLQYFTHMLINEINKDAEELADTEILIRAERYLNIKIRVTEVNKVNDLYPNSEMELLLVLCSGHYNVIMDFKQCINTINPMHKEYIYCYQHQNLFHKKNQCYECTQAEEVATKYYCTFCNYSHVRSQDNKSYQCQNCRTQLHNTPDCKCLE